MKNAKKIFSFCSGIILLFCFILSGCNISFEDYIPKKFGAPEGLYLYNGNIRSFTDGSEQTEILNEITLNENVYTSDDFEINSIAYMTETHEIFYSVCVDEKCLVWHVNYKSKVSEFLYEFPEGERASLDANDYYVLAESKSTGILFDKNAEIIDDTFYGFTLDKDVLYKIVGNTFEFWKDGKVNKVDIQFQLSPASYNTFYLGNYFYLFGYEKAVSVSLTNGATNFFDSAEYAKSDKVYPYRYAAMDNALYFVLRGNYNTLWKAENGKFEVVHTYSDENCPQSNKGDRTYEEADLIIKNYGNGIINFRYSCCWRGNGEHWYHDHYFYYDAESGEVKEGSKAVINERKVLIIGDYSFYITDSYYGHPLYGSFAGETGCFYYLNREKDGVKEIMQYKYVSSSSNETGKMYDDICEF